MKMTLVCFGKASAYASAEEARIKKRLRRLPLEIIELKESKQGGEAGLLEEFQLLQKRISPQAVIVALAEEGKHPSSVEFAQWIGNWEDRSVREVVLVIGSAYGLHPSLKQSAERLLSLSRMTLTHDFARVLLVEQIYRAQCILEGHPYHHV